MTEQTARTVANLFLGAAAVTAAYYVYSTPPLRRLAVAWARRWIGVSVPLFLLAEARQAWAEAGQQHTGAPPPRA
jgi:hypothetical protein